jgi:CRP-like cAMP-binding protein
MAAPDATLRAELLERTHWADDFSYPEILRLAGYFQSRTFDKGAVVFREGERDATLFVIAEGKVGVFKAGASKKDHPIATLGVGATLGEMALVDGLPRSAGAMAQERLVLLAISKAALDRLTEEHPQLAVKLIVKVAKLLSQRLRQTTNSLADRME